MFHEFALISIIKEVANFCEILLWCNTFKVFQGVIFH